MTTTVFREVTEKNVHFTGKLQSSMVTGLMFARMRQAAALGRRITCALRRTASQEEKLETEEEDRNEKKVTVVLLQKKKRLSKREKGIESRNE